MAQIGGLGIDGRREGAARRPRDRVFAWAGAAGVHGIALGLFLARPALLPALPSDPPALVTATLLQEHKPKPPRPPDPSIVGEDHDAVSRSPALPTAAPVADPVPAVSENLSELELSDSTIAGDEGKVDGGPCDTAGALQRALRADPMVRGAVIAAGRQSKATRVWNGDWVQSGGQDGKGLSVVREAILWQLAFAPEPCRNEQMHGTVLLSLADGETRFAIGSGDWRWSDLLAVHNATRVP